MGMAFSITYNDGNLLELANLIDVTLTDKLPTVLGPNEVVGAT